MTLCRFASLVPSSSATTRTDGRTTQATTQTTTQTGPRTTQEIHRATQETTQEIRVSTQEKGPSSTEKILGALRANPGLTFAELARQLGLSRDGVKYHVNTLKKTLGLRHEGPTKKGRWVLPDDK